MRRNIYKSVLLFAGFNLLMQCVFPTIAFALTSGPSQPEFSSFESVGMTEMVDLFTGDFTYNLPLLEVPGPRGGYPLNLFYQSVTNMEQEASMVGLGWNIGLGAIQRNLKGLPDDFNGEPLRHVTDRKNNITVGVSGRVGVELAPADAGVGVDLSANVQVLYNSYKGPGATFGYGASIKVGENPLLTPNFNSSFSTFDGVDYSLGVNIGKSGRIPFPSAGLSLGFNTLTGAKTYNVSFNGANVLPNPTTFFPSLSNEKISESYNLQLKGGVEIFTFEGFVGVGGSYSNERLKFKDVWRSSPMYGSMYLGEGQDINKALLDFSRTQDKALFNGNENLPAPVSGEDYYSVTGHGISGTFKLFRNDVGIFGDQSYQTTSGGGSVGVELSGGNLYRLGTDVTFNAISEQNDFRKTKVYENDKLHFKTPEVNSLREMYYFDFLYNSSGHLLSTNNGGHSPLLRDYNAWKLDEPLKLKINSINFPGTSKLTGQLIDKHGHNVSTVVDILEHRQPRNRPIQHYINRVMNFEENGKTTSALSQFDIDIYQTTSTSNVIPSTLNKSNYERKINDQIGAFTITDEQGGRWHYGLPVMNLKEQESTFSYKKILNEPSSCLKTVPSQEIVENPNALPADRTIKHNINQEGSEDYLDTRIMPEYAHTHLLTSLVSHDYIDNDLEDGPPNSSDFGHWVRFEYVQTNNETDPYGWRNPYAGAYFNGGLKSIDDDNKAFFTYGEREQYYPYRIYTATHYAQMHYSQREDSRGALCALPLDGEFGAHSFKLDSIQLFRYFEDESQDKSLIKTVKFSFTNPDPNGASELCPGVLNNETNGGKLTLHQVEINSYKSQRGSLTPYTFNYNAEGYNRAYDSYASDRWGVFSDPGTDICKNVIHPYTTQFYDDANVTLDEYQSDMAKSWHLESIRFPSGSMIEVDVGRDHYAHVQNKVATQMMKIIGVGQLGEHQIPVNGSVNPEEDLRIFFELNEPIPISDSDEEKELKLRQYFDHLVTDHRGRQVVFKINADMIPNQGYEEDVEGVCYLKKDMIYGSDFGSIISSAGRTQGWIEVLPESQSINGEFYHPMLVAGWQFNKTHLRSKISPVKSIFNDNDADGILKKMEGVLEGISDLFKNYYILAQSRGYGSKLNLDKSFIRLNHPTKKKFGGGVRVDRVVIKNIWDEENSPAYGNVYLYEETETISNQNQSAQIQREISTGVAVNEPNIGGIESAHRYYQQYTERIKNTTDNIHYDIHPVNEEYMPGAQVGYSKVKVRSLASEYHYRKFTEEDHLLPPELASSGIPGDGVASTGEAVYEFHTAKDYPVLFNKTRISEKTRSPATMLNFLIGGHERSIYRASQGYAIELNDMHGKPKAVKNFSQKKNGDMILVPTASTEYYYQDEPQEYYEGTNRYSHRRLVNQASLVVDDEVHNDQTIPDTRNGELGVSRQMFVDVRKFSYSSATAGAAGQLHSFYIPPWFIIVFPTGIPSIRSYASDVETAVVNKIICKKGIISKVVTWDGQSKSEAENLAFDPYTGQAVLQRVNNIYNDDQYSYTLPAYQIYRRMGPAYQNMNLSLTFQTSKSALEAQIDECTGYLTFPATGIPSINSRSSSVPSQSLNYTQGDEYLGNWRPVGGEYDPQMEQSHWTYMFVMNDMYYFHVQNRAEAFKESLPESGTIEVTLNMVRSGLRNQLAHSAMSLTSLSDPTISTLPVISENWSYSTCDHDLSGTIDLVTKNEVLDASVNMFEESWLYRAGPEEIAFDCVIDCAFNDFTLSNLGIFRPKSSFKFVSDRTHSSINKRGLCGDFYKFNWNHIDITNLDKSSRWICTNEITQYSKMGHPKESVDQFKNFTSYRQASYATNRWGIISGNLSNCMYKEGGFTSFEEDENIFGLSSNFGHIVELSPSFRSFGLDMAYDVLDIRINNNDNTIYFDKPVNFDKLSHSGAVKYEHNNQVFLMPWRIQATTYDTECSNFMKVVYPLEQLCLFENLSFIDKSNLRYLQLARQGDATRRASHLPFLTASASHSGQNSITAPSPSSSIDLSNLEIIPGKSYYFSLWTSAKLGTEYVNDVTNLGVQIEVHGVHLNGNDVLLHTIQPSTFKSGHWQRIDGVIDFSMHPSYLEYKSTDQNYEYFIDDLMIIPMDAQISTNILDYDLLRPLQSVDQNGFLTYYGYDEEGNLINLNKETEEGIFSIQEQRKYIQDQTSQ